MAVTKEELLADLRVIEAFTADELDCRESSMMPPSNGDALYIDSARLVLLAVRRAITFLSGEMA